MAKQNDYFRTFAEKVYASERNAYLPAFWKSNPTAWRVSPPVQAGLVSLWRDGKASCSGEPGNMTFYMTGNHPGRWLYKVNGTFKVYLTYVVFMKLMLAVASVSTMFADLLGVAMAAAACFGYLCKVSLSYTHGPLAMCLPRAGSRFSYNVKVGLYTLGWVCAAGFVVVLGRRLLGGEYGAGSLFDFGSHLKFQFAGLMPRLGDNKLMLGLMVFVFSHALAFLTAWFIGVSLMTGIDRSRHLMQHYGVYDRYTTQLSCFIPRTAAAESKVWFIGFFLAVVTAVGLLRPFW